jgi:hypothetical protein
MSHADLQAARKALRELTDAPKPTTRSVFNNWDAIRQSLFCAAGGKILNDPTPQRRAPSPPSPPVTALDLRAAHAADLKLSAAHRARSIR